MPQYAKLREDLVSSPAQVEGETVYNIKDPKTGRYFRLREPEYYLVRQLDGVTSYETVAQRFRDKFDLSIDTDNVRQFVAALEQLYFLENSRSEQELSRKSYTDSSRGSSLSRLLFIKIKAFSPGRFLDWLTRLYRPLHRPAMFAAELAVILLGVGLLLANGEQFAMNLYSVFNIGSVATIIISVFLLVTFHEFAHAVVCRYYGGEVREMGILLLYFQPCFYSDLSDAWLFANKRHRLAVTFAGLYSQAFLMAIAVIVWRVTIPGMAINDVARILTIVSWITLLFNFNPLIKLDGYYLLSDWLDIPNFRQKSFQYLGNLFKRKLLGWPIEALSVSPREKKLFVRYAVLAVLFSVVFLAYVFSSILTLVRHLFGVAGILLLLLVILYILRSSIIGLFKGIGRQIRYMKDIHKHPVRLTAYIVIVVVGVLLLFVIDFSHRVSGEIVIRPIAEYSLILNDAGILEQRLRRGGDDPESKSSYMQMTSTEMGLLELLPLVTDGQPVNANDTISVITSNQVTNDIVGAMAELERLRRQLILLKAPPKKEAVQQVQAQIAAAQTNYDRLLRDFNRAKELRQKNLNTSVNLESVQAELDIAAAELRDKEANLSLLQSPPRPEEEAVIDAEIARQQAELDFLISQKDAQYLVSPIAGKTVTGPASDNVLSVINEQVVEVLVPVSDFDIKHVQPGQRVRLKVRSYPAEVFEGTVVHLPQQAVRHSEQLRFPVTVILDNADNRLHKGMTGYAKIEIRKSSLFNLIRSKVYSVMRVEFWSWW